MTVLTAYEISSNYPDQIRIDSAGPNEHGKFACFMYRLKGDDIHKLMLSSEFVFNSAEEAKDHLHNVCKEVCKQIGVTGEVNS